MAGRNLLKAHRVMEILGISRKTMKRIVDSGDLPRYVFGPRTFRYEARDVERVRAARAGEPLAFKNEPGGGRSEDRVGFVYFMRCNNYVKIGFTSNYKKRLKFLQSGNPYELKLLAIAAGTQFDEKKLHHKFSAYRHRNEWFKLVPQVKKFIESLKDVEAISEVLD